VPEQPGERRPEQPTSSRRLEQPPSVRYTQPAAAPAEDREVAALPGPLARAIGAAAAGAVALFFVGAVLAQPAALLILAGATGAAIGLALARAAVPSNGARPVDRDRLMWIAIALAIIGVVAADVGTWWFALIEGGALGLVDYLWETFGLLVLGEAVVAVITAAWGAGAGPIQR
jgi:hypothetical protein